MNYMVKYAPNHGFTADHLVPMTDLQRAPGKVVGRVQRSKDPLWVTHRGRVAALLVSQERYEELLTQSAAHPGGERKQELLRALEEMLPVIVGRYDPEKIILFGSLAGNQLHEASDIDLLIVKKTNKRPLERRKELLQIVRPRIATDFFIYTPEELEQCRREKRSFFLNEIDQKGKVLYEKAA